MSVLSTAIASAYAAEVNTCSFNADAGPRIKSRPHEFCDSVKIGGTLEVTDTATFLKSVIIDGKTYKPAVITGLGASATILTVDGKPVTLTAPSIPEGLFHDLTVTGTLTVSGTASLDAGNY